MCEENEEGTPITTNWLVGWDDKGRPIYEYSTRMVRLDRCSACQNGDTIILVEDR